MTGRSRRYPPIPNSFIIVTSASVQRVALLFAIAHVNCASPSDRPAAEAKVSPVYSQQTGRLEEIVSDRNGDGSIDTRAFMDGTTIQRIEIDRNDDGRPDRWEHYQQAARPGAVSRAEIERAEEASGSDQRITRRELYAGGVVTRVEEDTDSDGRMDKWEHYAQGLLIRIELDLQGGGFADRRMVYRRDGSVERVEVDAGGRGNWRPFTPAGHAGEAASANQR